MFTRRVSFVLTFLCVLCLDSARAKGLSPLSMGLKDAQNGIEKFWVLYKTHREANKLGVAVDYSGIDSLCIEIPDNAGPIALKGSCDFCGLRLQVINKKKDIFLFEVSQRAKEVAVEKSMIDNGNYSAVAELSRGKKLLIIRDLTPWVKKRKGHEYGATRRDCLVLCNGKAYNRTIMPYDNAQSNPSCSFISIEASKSGISNLIFERKSSSTYKTFLIYVNNQYGVTFNNISTYTPQHKILNDDRIFRIENSANVVFKNCTINGSYSQRNKWGYGIYMDNVYNSVFYNFRSETNWGVFCTRSVSEVFLKDCRVNRFDTHCYGKNIYCENCYFYDRECSYTSFYGIISYKNCVFDDCLPVHIDNTYDTYTPFKLVMKKCVFRPSKIHDCIIYSPFIYESGNDSRREELKKNHWPDITIRDLKIETADTSLRNVFLFKFNKKNLGSKNNILKGGNLPTKTSLNKIEVCSHLDFHLSNSEID